MSNAGPNLSRYAVALVMLALPVGLLVNSVETFRELDKTQAVYLRNRVATIAAHLENADPRRPVSALMADLSVEEPALIDLAVYSGPDSDPDNLTLAAIWSGQVLFHTEQVNRGGEAVFRAWIPFHWPEGLRVAQISLAAEAGEFLVAHTRQNTVLSLAASLALVLFTIYFLWSEHRAARLERRHIELEHLARLGEMSAVLAHEIRNPLGAIKGFVQLAREKTDPESASLLQPVLQETDRLEGLVNDLLLYGRPREPRIQNTQWADIADHLRSLSLEYIRRRPITFIDESSVTEFKSDPDLLNQILINLVHNSIEALGDEAQGVVKLTARRLSSGVEVTVEDDGPGIPELARPSLFEPFFTTKSSGTGLGLPIARKLASALGGSLEVHPAHPRGTRAQLTLP